MSDVREMLDGIESTARRAPGMPPLWFYNRAIADVPRLVAALRAVLDLHRPMTESEANSLDLDAGDCFDCWQETPCDTVKAITEALGGGA